MASLKNKKVVLGALFLAMGMVLPLFTAQIKEVGDSLLPMHLPVLLCGLICGPGYGFAVGLILPFLRSMVFSMPPLYPNAIWMALEMAAYGGVIGWLYRRFPSRRLKYLYLSLIIAMVAGRLVWGLSKAILLGLGHQTFTLQAFLMGGVIDALPGILLQLVMIPAVMTFLHRKYISI